MEIPNSISLESVPCPLCDGDTDELVISAHDRLNNLPGEFSVVRCLKCGLMRTNPRPSPETIGFYYPENYGPYLGTRVLSQDEQSSSNKEHIFPKQLIRLLYRKIVRFNTSCIPLMSTGTMLEVGCASGSFLHQMAKKGWDVEGIEFSLKAAEAARSLGYKVYSGHLETAPDPVHSFDLIVGWMLLEHLHDPVAGLTKLHEWANADTWLVLSVPNAGSLEFTFFKNRWYALQLPTHLYHFTPTTITKVLAKGGWRIEKIYHQRLLSNLIASFGYLCRDKGLEKIGTMLINFPERSGRWHQILYPLAWLLSLFGQTGRMTVWAKWQP